MNPASDHRVPHFWKITSPPSSFTSNSIHNLNRSDGPQSTFSKASRFSFLFRTALRSVTTSAAALSGGTDFSFENPPFLDNSVLTAIRPTTLQLTSEAISDSRSNLPKHSIWVKPIDYLQAITHQSPITDDLLNGLTTLTSPENSKTTEPSKVVLPSNQQSVNEHRRNHEDPQYIKPRKSSSSDSANRNIQRRAEPSRLIFHAAGSGLQGISSLSGEKNHRIESLNEDAGSLCEADVEDLDHPEHHLSRLKILWIFDGHGPSVLNDIRSPGKLVAQTAITAHQKITTKRLGELIRAPVLPPDHQSYWTSSRQAVFSDLINETQNELRHLVQPIVTKWAGTTVTTLLALADDQRPDSPVSVICSNLGDSRAIALTFRIDRENDILIPEHIYTLTAEENIRTHHEKKWVHAECLKQGYRSARIDPRAQLRKPSLRLVMVPQKSSSFDISLYEPFSSLSDIEAALRHAKTVLSPGEEYSVYALQSPYLWKLTAQGFEYSRGLQVSHIRQ